MSADAPRLFGQTLAGRYRIGDPLGGGGFAWVFKARDLTLRRQVAIKILKPAHGGSYPGDMKARFLQEAQMTAQLEDPSTVTVYDVGEAETESGEGLLYMSMEYIQGETLQDRVRARGAFKPLEYVPVLRAILESLSEAHAIGFIHRDLKTANVMVREAEKGGGLKVKVLDYGIGKAIEAGSEWDQNLTGTGNLAALSLHFAAPEQLETEGALGPHTDLYALGMVSYVCLAGAHPRPGLNQHEMIASLLGPEDIELSPDKAGPQFSELVNKMLIKNLDPSRGPSRYTNSAELLDDLLYLQTKEGRSRRAAAAHEVSEASGADEPDGGAPAPLPEETSRIDPPRRSGGPADLYWSPDGATLRALDWLPDGAGPGVPDPIASPGPGSVAPGRTDRGGVAGPEPESPPPIDPPSSRPGATDPIASPGPGPTAPGRTDLEGDAEPEPATSPPIDSPSSRPAAPDPIASPEPGPPALGRTDLEGDAGPEPATPPPIDPPSSRPGALSKVAGGAAALLLCAGAAWALLGAGDPERRGAVAPDLAGADGPSASPPAIGSAPLEFPSAAAPSARAPSGASSRVPSSTANPNSLDSPGHDAGSDAARSGSAAPAPVRAPIEPRGGRATPSPKRTSDEREGQGPKREKKSRATDPSSGRPARSKKEARASKPTRKRPAPKPTVDVAAEPQSPPAPAPPKRKPVFYGID